MTTFIRQKSDMTKSLDRQKNKPVGDLARAPPLSNLEPPNFREPCAAAVSSTACLQRVPAYM